MISLSPHLSTVAAGSGQENKAVNNCLIGLLFGHQKLAEDVIVK